MPITGASGGIIGADNTPAAAGDGCVTAVTSTGCYTPTSTTATVIVVGGGGGAGTGGGGAGGVMVVSCHPLPTSNVPVQSELVEQPQQQLLPVMVLILFLVHPHLLLL